MIDIKNFFINTPQFLCIVIIVSLAIKCSLLAVLAPHRSRTKSINRSLVLLLGIIIGSMAGEIVWVLKLARILLFPSMPYSVIIFSVRLAWAFLIIQYVALGLFLESLTERIFHLNVIQKIVIVLSSSEVFYFLYLAFFSSDLVNEEERRVALSTESALTPYLEITIMRHTVLYILPLLMIPSLVRAIRRLNCLHCPKFSDTSFLLF